MPHYKCFFKKEKILVIKDELSEAIKEDMILRAQLTELISAADDLQNSGLLELTNFS